METVANIFLKSDNSFEINEISQVPIVFDQRAYKYYLSLLSFSFLNCSPNVYEINYFNYTLTHLDDTTETITKQISPGLYNTDDLINLLNSYFIIKDSNTPPAEHQILTFSINPFDEHVEIKFNVSEASTVDIKEITINNNYNNSILTNDLFRFSNTPINFNNSNSFYKSDKAFRISTYNNIMLSSASIPGLVSLYGNNDGITTSSALYVISSVADPYSMIEYTAIQPVDFPLDNIPSLTNFQFKLYDENNNELKLLQDATPDFSVKFAIKRIKR